MVYCFDHGSMANRYRKVAADIRACPKPPSTNFFARTTFALPRIIWSDRMASCGL